MDSVLWSYGQSVAKSRQHLKHPWELDVLRGMHQQQALNVLAMYLGVQTGEPIRLTSIWMDKQVWVSWTDAQGITQTNKELADLAVVVRRKRGHSIHRWMWIAQAKSMPAMLATYTGASSINEIDLLHRMPKFKLANVVKDFNLQADFGNPAIAGAPWNRAAPVPWTFLDFDQDPQDPKSATKQGVTPIAARWPACQPDASNWAAQTMTSSGLAELGLASYSECLVAIINNQAVDWHQAVSVQTSMIPGAPIVSQYPEWSRLYYHLMRQNSAAKNGHASVTQGNKEDVIHISQMMTDHSYPHLFSKTHFPIGSWPSDSDSFYQFWRYLDHKEILTGMLGKADSDLACSFSTADILSQSVRDFDQLCANSEPNAPGNTPPNGVPGNFEGEPEGQMQFLMVDVIGSE